MMRSGPFRLEQKPTFVESLVFRRNAQRHSVCGSTPEFYRSSGQNLNGVFSTTILRRRAAISLFTRFFSKPTQNRTADILDGQLGKLSSSGAPTKNPEDEPPSRDKNDFSLPQKHGRSEKEKCRGKRQSRNRGATTTTSTGPTRYKFPVGRALRFAKKGQQFHYPEEGHDELQEWLAANGSQYGQNTDVHENAASPKENVDPFASSAVDADGGSEDTQMEVSLFTKYHAHHVLVEFKRLRHRLTEQQQQTSSNQHEGNGNVQHRNTDVNVSFKSVRDSSNVRTTTHKLSSHDIEALTELLFAATVLLHIGGLHSVADTHAEPLIEVCFSATIFLARDAATTARLQTLTAVSSRNNGKKQATDLHGTNQLKSPSEPSSTKIVKSSGESDGERFASNVLRPRYLHSLHWSIVHFAAAVQCWGLLEHNSPLQDLRKTQRPYERLLQVHAALLCDLTRKHIDPVLWRELVLLKSGQRAPASQAGWFLSSNVDAYKEFFGCCTDGTAAQRVPPRLQQRRLQLLPMLWLSLLSSQLARQAEHAQDFLNQTEPHSSYTAGTQHYAGAVQCKPRNVNWGSARHAFTSLLPLFAHGTGYDVTAWALLHLLFLPDDGKAVCGLRPNTITPEGASLTETCALLARVEQSDAALELGEVLPLEGLVTESSQPAPLPNLCCMSVARCRMHFLLAHFLQRFIGASGVNAQRAHFIREPIALNERWCSTTPTSSSGQANLRGQGKLVLTCLPVSQTRIRRPVQLYRALVNIPLCTLWLPDPQLPLHKSGKVAPQKLSSLPVSADGVRIVNMLLLRALVQWRAYAAHQRQHKDSTAVVCSCNSCATLKEKAEDSKSAETEGIGCSVGENSFFVAATHTDWENEVLCVLKAAHHLHQILRQIATSGFDAEKTENEGIAMQFALLVSTVQAAARALSEQLGVSLFARRLDMLSHRNRSDICFLQQRERMLIQSLDQELRNILLHDWWRTKNNSTSDQAPEPLAGALPWSYQQTLSALLDYGKEAALIGGEAAGEASEQDGGESA